MENQVLQGDALEQLLSLQDNSVDTCITDPPYGYSFMGKDWDKAVPSVALWRQVKRVLKPGGFAFVMSAPRSDVQNAMISRLMEAGFRMDFTPIYWTYASGFPKATNTAKLVDKRLGAVGEVIETRKAGYGPMKTGHTNVSGGGFINDERSPEQEVRSIASEEAKQLDGSYLGFQPKPAVEVILVAMKPLSEKTFVDQALKNGKGITWLDDCRVPFNGDAYKTQVAGAGFNKVKGFGENTTKGGEATKPVTEAHEGGRFPANLIVSNDVLNDGVERKTGARVHTNGEAGFASGELYGTDNGRPGYSSHQASVGSYSRFFDLDAWAKTLPFLVVAKASKSEKNAGTEHMPERMTAGLPMRSADGERGGVGGDGSSTDRLTKMTNHHPTVKPLKLMAYLITLGSRKGDTVLDPFLGSGSTAVAAKLCERKYIGVELMPEYTEIAKARLKSTKEPEPTLF